MYESPPENYKGLCKIFRFFFLFRRSIRKNLEHGNMLRTKKIENFDTIPYIFSTGV